MASVAPDGTVPLLLLVFAALAAPLWCAWLATRRRRGRAHRGGRDRAVRILAAVLCPVTAAAAVLAAVNRETQAVTDWAQLAGARPAGVPADPPATVPGGASRLVTLTVRGRASGITLPATVYLPAGYPPDAGDRLDADGRRYPVVEFFAGFPGGPRSWLGHLDARRVLDTEIAAGRMAPVVAVFPVQNSRPTRDSECVDAVRGDRFDTYLSRDVPDAVQRAFRVRTDRDGWAAIGYSTGGFCAVNLAVRHPARYAAAASLSGYFQPVTDATTGDLYRSDPAARRANDPLWRLRHRYAPPVALYLCGARDDRGSFRDLRTFAAAVRGPTIVDTGAVDIGGHSFDTWRALAAPALDWLSGHLAGPTRART